MEALPPSAGAESAGVSESEEDASSPEPEELPPSACRWIMPPPLLVLDDELPLAAGAADRARGMARPVAVAVRLGAGAGWGAGAGAAATR